MGPDKYIKNYIDGTLAPANAGNYLDNYNPATGMVYSFTPDSDENDVLRAVEAAQRAFPEWSGFGLQKRFRILMRIADIIEQNMEIFAKAETADTGKPFSMSRGVDIPRAQANFRFFATAILHFSSESHWLEKEAVNYTLRQPIGVVGCIAPWNLPLHLFTWKIAPALAAGNCVIAKPSELTPMTAYMLGKACIEAGLPAGVLNIIHGTDEKVAQKITENPQIRALSFTGSLDYGKKIIETAAPALKKLSLELGGKNANIIFEDCNFDDMMIGTLRSSFSNNGQISLCGSRIFIERPLYEKFREEFVKRTQFLKVGDPFSTVTDLGALISEEHLQNVINYLTLAEVEGGTILCGGTPVKMEGDCEKGYFLRPAIVEGLSIDSRTNQEEIFGPIVTIAPFDTEEEVVQLANSTQYGLAASVWSKDIGKANRVAERLQAGMVWLNCWMLRDLRTPYGGTKNSGMGREGGLEALRFFTEIKNVCVKY